MATKRKKKQAKSYLARFKDNNSNLAENKASKIIDEALRELIPEDINEEPSQKIIMLMIQRVRTLEVEFPKSYRKLVDYLANNKPIDDLTPHRCIIVRYILTTLSGYDPIARMILELKETNKTCKTTSRKKKV